jgi:hypothetical protein
LPEVTQEESEYAKRGTLCHEKVSRYLLGTAKELPNEPDLVKYIDYVRGAKIEKSLTYKMMRNEADGIDYILSGRCDAYRVKNRTLEVIDLKTGYERPNLMSAQLKGYAYLALKMGGIKDEEIDHLRFTIFQDGTAFSYVIEIHDFCKDFEEAIRKSIKNSRYEEGEHCRYCASKIFCKKMLDRAYMKIEKSDYDGWLALLRSKGRLEKLITDARRHCLEHRKDAFMKTTRRKKEWIDESRAPKKGKTLTPSEAIKEGLIEDESNIREVETIVWRLRASDV